MAFYIVAAEEQGVPAASFGHDSERHSERIHGAEYVYLSAVPFDAHGWDIFRYCSAQTCRNSIRISISGYHMQEAGATRGYRTGVHAGGWSGIFAAGMTRGTGHGQICATAVFFLGDWHELFHGNREDAGGARMLWAKIVKAVQSRRIRNRWRCARIRRRRAGA